MVRTSTLRIAWRNMWRNPGRTALALLAIGIGQWALLASQGLMRGYGDNIRNAITGPMVGHIQLHHPDYRKERALDLVIEKTQEKLAWIKNRPQVKDAVARIHAPVLIAPDREAFIATVIGIDVAGESQPFGLLSGNLEALAPGHVMLGYRLARKSGAGIGDEVALVGQAFDGSLANDLYTVQSIMKGPVDHVNQSGVVMRLDDAQTFLGMTDEVHEIIVRTQQLEAIAPLMQQLKTARQLSGLEILSWDEIVPELVIIIDMVDYTGWFVLVLVLIAATAGIINTLLMATYERMHEFGMLLALGCRPIRIAAMIMMEAVFLGILGTAMGTGLGLGFVAVFRKTGIDMSSWGGDHIDDLAYAGMRLPLDIVPRIEWHDPLTGLFAVILVSLLASLWPALSAGRLDPMEAMRA
jgi:ABC-type lipoprotein release transport system permease subunit